MWSEGQWEANEDISQTMSQSLNQLISDGGDCRTAPATPGLLNIVRASTQDMTDIIVKTALTISTHKIISVLDQDPCFSTF